ncbi:MAG TPA: hypothetical protein VFN44_12440 [Solirubrobacteraceae bacterium]|nr:hypothetical protein [Solirubrobacteraceae bacterium]
MARPGLISVQTQVVLDTLVGSLAEGVAARLATPLNHEVEAALHAAGADDRLARKGYHARALEYQRFDRAREPMPWLAERFAREHAEGAAWSTTAAMVATSLAASEPSERPEPDDPSAISWRVPGPGGHVRHYLAHRAATEEGRFADAETKRSWLAGFLVGCIAEAAPP